MYRPNRGQTMFNSKELKCVADSNKGIVMDVKLEVRFCKQ